MSKQVKDLDDYSDLLDIDLPFDIKKVRSECIKCIRRQIEKFKNNVDENKKSLSKRFIVPCEGMMKNPIDSRLKHVLSPEEWEQAQVVVDPVKWAAKYITHPDDSAWIARNYQEEVMRCTSKRRALRISRRTGKCISEESQVLTEAGPVSAKDLFALKEKPKIVSFNEDTLRTEFADANIFDNGTKPVFLLRTKNGRETTVTDNHPFLTRQSLDDAKWIEAKNLKIGDTIAVPSGYDHLKFRAENIGERRARLLGYLTGDGGTSHKTTVRFTNFNKEIVDDFSSIINDFGCELNEIADGNYNVVISGKDYGSFKKNKINKLVTNEGLRKLAVNKCVPKSILNSTTDDICNFLGAYWDCDGWASVGKNIYNNKKRPNVEVGACSASKKLAIGIKHLLLRIGIHSNLKKKKVKYNDGYNTAWQITMAGKDSIEKFYHKIPLRAKKQNIQDVYDIVKDRKTKTCNLDFFWDPVVAINYIGEQQTYDLSVPSNHTLVADDIISHNTDVVSVEICYHMFTKKGQRILVAAPQKVHVEEIIERIRGFLQRNGILYNEVVRDVSSPFYEILLSNGSRVRGFALGTRGKSEGVAVRGQNADRIYCLPKGTPVHTSEFGLKPVEKLTLEDKVLGGDHNGVCIGDIKNLGTRKDTLVTIPTDLSILKCTPDHPLFNGNIDVPARDADNVICSLYYKDLTFGRDVVFARLLGYLYGDGWISNKTVGFSGGEKDLEQIQEDLNLFGISKHTVTTRTTENKELGIKGTSSQFATSYAYDLFKDKHPSGRKVLQPLRVPKCIMDGTEYIKSSFLSGLFSAEGEGVKYQSNKKTPRVIRLNMRSLKEEWIKDWIADLSDMLNSLLIDHYVDFKEIEDRFIGTITIRNSKINILNFINKIGYCYSADKTISANVYKLFIKYENRWKSDSWKKNRKINNIEGSCSFVSDKLEIPVSTVKYHKNLYDKLYSEELLTPHEYLNKIKWKDNYVILPVKKENVKFTEEEVDVYNLTSGASNRFFAGGMFTHNCDEMDYADDKAIIGGLFPILQTTPDTAMTGFSTPTGFKSTYYAICEEVPSYKEFFYNYKVLPHWRTVEKDRPQYTDDEWTHEMLAEWGTAESGVYKPSYVDRSLRSYQYEEMRPSAGWRYTIGVDWNEKHGAEFVVVGENISGGFYQVMHASVVEKSEFTQLSSVEGLISLYKIWNPVSIYVDAGNGCLYKDSLVYTDNGVKEIQNISVGEKVLSHNGIFREVLNSVSTGTKDSYFLKPAFCLPVKASDSHKHIVYRSKDRFNDFDNLDECNISDLGIEEYETPELNKDKDFLIIPKQKVSAKSSYIVDLVEELAELPNLKHDEKYVWTKHGVSCSQKLSVATIIEKYNTSRPTVQRTKRKLKNNIKLAPAELRLAKAVSKDYGDDWYDNTLYKKIPRYINILDPDFLNLYGWYLSEGHAGVNNIEICQMPFHYKEEFDNLIKYCSRNWDCNVLVKSNGMRRLFILNSLLTKFFKKIGGSKCYNKFIDNRILENNGHQLLPSLFWGDGHEHKHGVNLSLTSDTLIMQVRQMLVNNGILAGLHRVSSRKRTDSYNSRPQLMLYLNANKNNVDKINNILKSNVVARDGIYRRKYVELNDCFLTPIKKLDYIGKVEDMYDLTIAEDSSFCVNGFATHNSTNYELIRKMSYDQRKPGGDLKVARLLDIVKRYDSGASIESTDPVTNEKRKIPAKPYMVNAAVRAFEQDRMRISSADKLLEKQIRNYSIDRISPTGTPVYAMRDQKIKDHRLDAFNLAMVAFFREFGGLQQNHIITHAIATVNPITKQLKTNKRADDSDPSERRIDKPESILNGLTSYKPAHVGRSGQRPISGVNTGAEYDMESEYNRIHLQRQRRRSRVNSGKNIIRRTNI